MSTTTFVDQKRAGNVIRENIGPVQIDQTDDRETSYLGGAAPKFDHWIYVNAVPDIRLGDQLIDRNADIKGVKNAYRVSKLPEFFDMACMEIGCELIAGT
jgi:hypothetical protein